MTNLYARKLEKIFNNVGKIASKGRDNKIEYTKYIDDLIRKGDFSAFQEMLYIFYQIDTLNMQDVPEIKSKTWDEICFQTKTPFMARLSKLYKQKNVYQQSYNIYSDSVELLLVSISDRLSTTFSTTGLTPSLLFQRNGDMLDLYVYDNNMYQIQIHKADWQVGQYGYEEPQTIRFIEDIQISYFANSSTEFNPSLLNIGDSFTMSMTTGKQFIPDQVISVTYSSDYIEGTIQSYDKVSGETVISLTDTFGSSTYSSWTVNYISGTKSATFSTNIPTTHGADYLIRTYSKDSITQDLTIYNYKLSLEKTPLLGQIYEVDTYTPNVNYLMQNKQYARLVGERRVYLEVTKTGTTFSVYFDYENPALSDDSNLINRYTSAINYLLS